jgi:O-acetyl-ADP-ribose deacetylase (regulator of RNase III)
VISVGEGDLLQAPVDALVNPVNTVGVMGAGLAKQFAAAYPTMLGEYRNLCATGRLQPGVMHVWGTGLEQPRFVVNFPTKRDWRSPSKLEDVHRGLEALVEEVGTRHISSIALPALGCGLGGLEWRTVRRAIAQAFRPLPEVTVLLFEPR